MPAKKRFKTKYVGVYYIESNRAGRKSERIYYISYRKAGKVVEEKAGKQFEDNMTPAKASGIRARRMQGKELSNRERRKIEEEELCKWTFNRLWDKYKHQRPDLKGLVTDDNRYQKHIEPFFGNKEPKEIIPLDVDRLRLKLLKTRKPATVRNVLELIQRISNFGTKKQLCEGLSFKIEKGRVDNLVTEDLSPEQLSKLLEVLDSDHDVQAANLMKLVLFTGMRRGELFRLRWDDIDYGRAFINIRKPKGGIDQIIPLNNGARDILENHPRDKSDFVFPGRNGRQRTDIRRPANRIKQRAGLPKDFRPLHGLRHVFASMMASSGEVGMFQLQKLLTHKDARTTQRYAHLRDDALKRASDVADTIINDAINQK